MLYQSFSLRRALLVVVGIFAFVVLASYGEPTQNIARGQTVPPPPLQYSATVAPQQVQSGGTVTLTATITNPGTISQTATSIIFVSSGVEEIINYSAPGDILPFGSTSTESSTAATYYWTVDVPPGQTVTFTLVAKTMVTQESIDMFDAFSWNYGNDEVWFGGFTLLPADPATIEPVLFDMPESATLGDEVCISGTFPADDAFMTVVLSQPDGNGRIISEVINLIPTSWSDTQVCFDSSELGTRDGVFRVRVESRGFYSNSLLIRFKHGITLLFLPLINR